LRCSERVYRHGEQLAALATSSAREPLAGGGVKVSVTDSGTGIGSQDLGRIFNPLFTTKSDGMGMGLSICRSIIEAHDGRLWVARNKPEGAVFQFILPADEVIE
jgi:signal transduction histidine kinase